MSSLTPPPAPRNMRDARNAPIQRPRDMKGTLRRLMVLTKGKRRGLGWILLMSALTSGSAMLGPLLLGQAVTAIGAGDPVGGLLTVLLAVYAGDWLVRFLQQYLMASVGQRMIDCIRTALFARMKELPLSFFDRHRHGELMSRLTNDVDTISSTMSSSLTQLMTYFFTITGIFVIMVSMDAVLTAVTLLSTLSIIGMTRAVTKRTRRLYKEQQQILGSLNGLVEETVSGEDVVHAFCREQETIAAFEADNERLRRVSTKALIFSGYLMPMTNVINNVTYIIIAVVSGAMAVRGRIEIGMILSFLLYVRQFTRPFVNVASLYNTFQSAVAGAERVFEIMDEPPEPADVPDAKPLDRPQGSFELKNVTFGYDPDKPILKDVSLTVPAGTRTAIVGPTGAGKTTIINLLTRFYDVDGGSILLDGTDLRDFRMADLRRAFGVVLQDTALFNASVADNIRYGSEDAPMERVIRAAGIAGADPMIRRLPNGYDTVLTQAGQELSQGERQLLTIARAVLTDAPILILDEATSSVDTVTEQRIRRTMLAITEGRTSFIIAHRLSTIRDSDMIILIDGGRIAEKGTHEELLALNGRYAEMYRTQCGENS